MPIAPAGPEWARLLLLPAVGGRWPSIRSSHMRGWALLVSGLLHMALLGWWLTLPVPAPLPAPPVEPPALPVELVTLAPPVEAAPVPAAAEAPPSETPPAETPPAEPAPPPPAPETPAAAPPPAAIAGPHPIARLAVTKPPRPNPSRPHAPPPAAAPAAVPATPETPSTPETAIGAAPTNPPPVPPDYIGLIQTRLASVKGYPTEARLHALEGVVLLRFVLAADGAVLSARVIRGSGVATLDAEGLAMIARASPFPPLPGALRATPLTLAVPVAFSLRAH